MQCGEYQIWFKAIFFSSYFSNDSDLVYIKGTPVKLRNNRKSSSDSSEVRNSVLLMVNNFENKEDTNGTNIGHEKKVDIRRQSADVNRGLRNETRTKGEFSSKESKEEDSDGSGEDDVEGCSPSRSAARRARVAVGDERGTGTSGKSGSAARVDTSRRGPAPCSTGMRSGAPAQPAGRKPKAGRARTLAMDD